MTPEAFRAMALSFPQARERTVLGACEYRVRDRAFATSGWPQDGWITVRIPAHQQVDLLPQRSQGQAIPGRPGVIRLLLSELDEEALRPVIDAAWRLARGAD